MTLERFFADAAAWLDAGRLPETWAVGLAPAERAQFDIYPRHVALQHVELLRGCLPRTAQRTDATGGAFDTWVREFIHANPLREWNPLALVAPFVTWLATRPGDVGQPAEWLIELADLEATQLEVATTTRTRHPESLALGPAVELRRYRYRVHEPPCSAHSTPVHHETALVVARDVGGVLRTFEPSEGMTALLAEACGFATSSDARWRHAAVRTRLEAWGVLRAVQTR